MSQKNTRRREGVYQSVTCHEMTHGEGKRAKKLSRIIMSGPLSMILTGNLTQDDPIKKIIFDTLLNRLLKIENIKKVQIQISSIERDACKKYCFWQITKNEKN